MHYYIKSDNFPLLDKEVTASSNISASLLMENAGNEMGHHLLSLKKKEAQYVFFCGTGSNGGDGLVAARYLLKHNLKVQVYIFQSSSKKMSQLFSEKLELLKYFTSSIIFIKKITPTIKTTIKKSSVIVDALFGTGLNKPIEGELKQLIEFINKVPSVIKVALDVPSGLYFVIDGGVVFNADKTLCVQYHKDFFLFPWFARFIGEVSLIKIDFPEKILKKYRLALELVEYQEEVSDFSNKYTYGTSIILAGSKKYPGAALLALKSSLLSGARYLSLISPIKLKSSSYPQVIPIQVNNSYLTLPLSSNEIKSLNKAKHILFGPGVDRQKETTAYLQYILEQKNKNIVIDADGIFHFKKLLTNKKIIKNFKNNKILLTPHLGELSQLLSSSLLEIKKDLFTLVQNFQKKYNVDLLVKDAFMFYFSEKIYYYPYPNSYLAKAGSGDILSGMILGYLSNDKNPSQAIKNAIIYYIKAGLKISRKYDNKRPITDLLKSKNLKAIKFK